MKASELDPQVYHSFPEFAQYNLPLELVNASLLITLQDIRDETGIPITPSPVHDGWARTDGSQASRHYAVGRLSDAGDVFAERGLGAKLFFKMIEVPNIGGLGIYVDTNGLDGNPQIMVHFDLRPHRSKTIWVRNHKYEYLNKNLNAFFDILKIAIDMEKGFK